VKARFRLSLAGMLLKKRCSRICVFLNDRKGRKALSRFRELSGSTTTADSTGGCNTLETA
jgi:hypothetical protein